MLLVAIINQLFKELKPLIQKIHKRKYFVAIINQLFKELKQDVPIIETDAARLAAIINQLT